MSLIIGFQLLALLCAIPTTILAFKPRFNKNFKDHCHDELIKEGEFDYKKAIRLDYRILAQLLYNIDRSNWQDIFSGGISKIEKDMNADKSDAVRGLIWFSFAFLFALSAIILSISK